MYARRTITYRVCQPIDHVVPDVGVEHGGDVGRGFGRVVDQVEEAGELRVQNLVSGHGRHQPPDLALRLCIAIPGGTHLPSGFVDELPVGVDRALNVLLAALSLELPQNGRPVDGLLEAEDGAGNVVSHIVYVIPLSGAPPTLIAQQQLITVY